MTGLIFLFKAVLLLILQGRHNRNKYHTANYPKQKNYPNSVKDGTNNITVCCSLFEKAFRIKQPVTFISFTNAGKYKYDCVAK